jgi:putative Flp pilus-assembly TadE/G-like protein
MKNIPKTFLPRFATQFMQDQRGQVLPWMALLMVLFLGMAGLTIDLGRAYVCYRNLQSSTDAAALAGAYAMTPTGATVSSAQLEACTYSSNTIVSSKCSVVGKNSNSAMASVTTIPTLKCAPIGTIVTVDCGSVPTGYNVIQVTQSATIPTYFIQVLSAFGVKSAKTLTLNTMSTASVTGSSPPVNMAIVLDTTESMQNGDSDAYCESTEIACALSGMRGLLTALTPCTSGSSLKAGCLGAYDQVSLFTFPNIQANLTADDTSCPTSAPKPIPSYSYVPIPSNSNTTWKAPTDTSPTYQVTTFEDDYSVDNEANGGIATGTPLGAASGAGSCAGIQAPGGDGTYIASAMYAAITSLQAAAAANPNSVNALVLLTDGGANSTSFNSTFTTTAQNPPANPVFTASQGNVTYPSVVYPSPINQCQQTVNAGQYATSLGITVYVVAYGASTDQSQCTTDSTTTKVNGKTQTNYVISPCTELEETASSPSTFYSDASATENKGQCVSSSNSGLAGLPAIFGSITTKFLKSRLVPNAAVNTGS